MPGFDPSLWRCLRRPAAQLVAFDAARPPPPLATWAALFAIAVSGSLLYGASLALVWPRFTAGAGALWILAAAGLGWLVFGPALILVTRRRALTCAHACMITMAYGEAALAVGAAVNVALWLAGAGGAGFNLAWLFVANAVMAASLAAQLKALGVPPARTLAVWILALDGAGALFFFGLGRLLGA
jgi:hypothetical protein